MANVNNPPRNLLHRVSEPLDTDNVPWLNQRGLAFETWRGDKNADECMMALYDRLEEISSRLDKTSTQGNINEGNILSLFRMKSESKRALMTMIDDGIDEENENLNCYYSAMCTARRVVKRLASALYAPPPSADNKMAKALMASEHLITLQCQFDGDSTETNSEFEDTNDDVEDNDMSLSIHNGEE